MRVLPYAPSNFEGDYPGNGRAYDMSVNIDNLLLELHLTGANGLTRLYQWLVDNDATAAEIAVIIWSHFQKPSSMSCTLDWF